MLSLKIAPENLFSYLSRLVPAIHAPRKRDLIKLLSNVFVFIFNANVAHMMTAHFYVFSTKVNCMDAKYGKAGFNKDEMNRSSAL